MSRPDLHLHLDTYLSVREALGFQLRAERTLLRDFIRFVENAQSSGAICAQLAVDWACASSSKRGPSGASRRLSMARRFLTYLRATLPETEIPGRDLISSARRPKPFLLSTGQLQTLMRAAQEGGPQGALRPYTLSTLIGLLASTGLRTGEAIRLTMTDVDLANIPPFLHIRQTKFHKSRLVPLHASTADQLHRYIAMRRQLRYDGLSDALFVSEEGQALSYRALAWWFTTKCRQIGIEPVDGGRRPTLHALRHTFAVERIRRWYQEGVDVQALLPHLSVYLGHIRPQESYWYLSATPELLTAAAARFQYYAIRGESS
jgi:integrase/recombinase XerD